MEDYQKIAKEIRKKVLAMGWRSQEGHIGCALSCVDILTVLYFGSLSIDPKNPQNENRDRFIFSKGHAASALYATLCQRGFFPEAMLDTYCEDGSKLAGHATRGFVPGIEVTTGSLGHGLPMALGMALAFKKDKKSNKVVALISDGECDEGTTWEAVLFAAHNQLDNLTLIIDYNKLQGFGKTQDVLGLEPLAKKFEDFGWGVREVDGHNVQELEKTFLEAPFQASKPSVVICHTTKGRGVLVMENKLEWHYHHLDKETYQKALEELS